MELLRLALVGGLVGLDTTAAFQVMICQPLVGGLLTGWALGALPTGAWIGLLFQGLYLAEFPIGGRLFPDGNLAAVQTAALAIVAQSQWHWPPGISLLLAFLWSIPAALIGGQVIVWTRRLHTLYLPLLDRLVAQDRRRSFDALFGLIIIENFVISAALTVMLFFCGKLVLRVAANFLANVPLLENWGRTLQPGLLGAGCAVIVFILLGTLQGAKRWLAVGSVTLAAVAWVVGY